MSYFERIPLPPSPNFRTWLFGTFSRVYRWKIPVLCHSYHFILLYLSTDRSLKISHIIKPVRGAKKVGDRCSRGPCLWCSPAWGPPDHLYPVLTFSLVSCTQTLLPIIWMFWWYYVLQMVGSSKSLKFYDLQHFSEIVPQFLDTVYCRLVDLWPSLRQRGSAQSCHWPVAN